MGDRQLSISERIQLLKAAYYGKSQRSVAKEFNDSFPHRTPISQGTVSKLIARFEKTGSVCNKPMTGRHVKKTNEEHTIEVLASVSVSPQKSIRKISQESGLSYGSTWNILKKNKLHAYRPIAVQELEDDDFDRRMEFCQWVIEKLEEDPSFIYRVIFSDEATFQLCNKTNHQNHRYWAEINPHLEDVCHSQHKETVNVWCGIWNGVLIGPYFIEGKLTGQKYLNLLEEIILPGLPARLPRNRTWWQQDGAPPHYDIRVRSYLDREFPGRWIGRRGPCEWPPRSPDLNPLDFCVWGHLKSCVFKNQPRNSEELKQNILDVCTTLTEVKVKNMLKGFQHRVFHCVAAGGHRFEHLL